MSIAPSLDRRPQLTLVPPVFFTVQHRYFSTKVPTDSPLGGSAARLALIEAQLVRLFDELPVGEVIDAVATWGALSPETADALVSDYCGFVEAAFDANLHDTAGNAWRADAELLEHLHRIDQAVRGVA